jgi:predicted AAA+ superfamily ATPase
MKRIYEAALQEHVKSLRQMAFLTGPRQVGKTTTCRTLADEGRYLNWDKQSDRTAILKGPDAVASALQLHQLTEAKPLIVLDEIHKYSRWKNFLKGFFDEYGQKGSVIVTGSSRLDVYKRGGDSLMGRYFPYRMHPVSLAELTRTNLSETGVQQPQRPAAKALEQLLMFGGFPEPFLKADSRFSTRWKRLRGEQLVREDIRDLTRIQDLGQLEMLMQSLILQAGQLVNYSTLANRINTSVDTIRRWVGSLESFYFCFEVRPWFRNVAKSLRKQPKLYLWDWSLSAAEGGARYENLIASHLLKSVHWWTDRGLGNFGLYFLRDKTGREVDFLVAKDNKPWFLVEVKSSNGRDLNPALEYFQTQTRARHAFQVVSRMPFVARDCFEHTSPLIVPAATFLSQLV